MGRSKSKDVTAAPAAAPPAELVLKLFAPGMTALHRAGLGGLACTLRYIEKAYRQGAVSDDEVPGDWTDGHPWDIQPDRVTLKFGPPAAAREYLKRLFALAFQVKDGLIYLPGQYADVPPGSVALASMQEGTQLTFLQHGPTCGSREGEREATVEVNETPYRYKHDVFTSYKHQGWFWLDRDEKSKDKDPVTGKKAKTGRREKKHQSPPFVLPSGELAGGAHPLDIKILPGATTRHDKFSQSAVVESDAGLICLHFALIGALTLPVNGITAVLVVPQVDDLDEFAASRPYMTPTHEVDSRVGGGADAALQLQVRLKVLNLGLTACHALTFRPTAWAPQQKSRVHTVYVPKLAGADLDVYELALAHLPPRIVTHTGTTSTGRGEAKVTTEKRVAFRTDSVVRPLIADNLSVGRRWYAGFARLMTAFNPATKKPFRDDIRYEQRGLHAMVSDAKAWTVEGERLVVQAVHEAIRQRFGRIAELYESEPKRMEKKFDEERERLRRSFAGAKTVAQARNALYDLFSRAGLNSLLQTRWQDILPVLRHDWQLARDLGLLALASYAGRGTPDGTKTKPTTKE